MRKIFRYALTGFVAASFSHIAFAQSVGTSPSTGDTTVSPNVRVMPHGTYQGSTTIGDNNQSGQTLGNENQTSNTQQSGVQNQNSTNRDGSTSAQGQSYGSSTSSGGSSTSSGGARCRAHGGKPRGPAQAFQLTPERPGRSAELRGPGGGLASPATFPLKSRLRPGPGWKRPRGRRIQRRCGAGHRGGRRRNRCRHSRSAGHRFNGLCLFLGGFLLAARCLLLGRLLSYFLLL